MKSLLLTGFLFFSIHCLSQPLWMRYPSISPNGNLIAFSYQGDIFVVNSKGGSATQITSHLAHDYKPIWSPDGKMIAFASNRHGNFDVFIVSAKGGSPKRLSFHSSNDIPYDFSPDGSKILFGSSRVDDSKSVQFPNWALSELYEVPTAGGREKQFITVAAEDVQYSEDGKSILFHNRKGYEDPWRKHHTSSVTRDIIQYNLANNKYTQITNLPVEDRNPVWTSSSEFIFLSEKSSSFNIWSGTLENPYKKKLTDYENHPVRFLSRSSNGLICYGYQGEIYLIENGISNRIQVDINKDQIYNETTIKKVATAGEFDVSNDGKEIAFIYRGEVFVTSVDYATTKKITNTPEQERSVSFSKDGKKLVYASERNESWNIYTVERKRETENHFYNSTLLLEKEVVNNGDETFQPGFSPDGMEIAFLENRTTLKIINLASKKERVVLDGSLNYSYSDGDQSFTWSPDSKWLLVTYLDAERWKTDIGLVNTDGKQQPINLTQSGYTNWNGKFAMNGEMVYYYTGKHGMTSHGGHGSQGNVEAVFLTESAYQKFILNTEEFEEWESEQESDKDEKKEEEKEKEDKDEKEEIKPLKIELENLQNRRVLLTIHSSELLDYLIDKKGEKMYYLTRFEKGYNLWSTDFKEKETKMLVKLDAGWSSIAFTKDEKNIFVNKNGNLMKVDVSSGKLEPISISSEMNLNASAEREYMFNHAWRQVREKFYVKDLHGVDWEMYKSAYSKFLPHINNGYDFAEMLSELLGELNASHTGARYRSSSANGDQTAALGCYYDESHKGDGLKVLEILPKGPLSKCSPKVINGVIIEKIDGETIVENENYLSLLNRKIGKKMLLSFFNPTTKERWEETVKPISTRSEENLLYNRWIKNCEDMVDELSGGKLGYVHVKSMSPSGFTSVYDKALGKHNKKEGLIVDTRFNGGGWLHDDLATFLSGKAYMTFEPRGQTNMGGEPLDKWQKKSCVLMSEGNYSDAHLFPYVYKQLGIGKLIGMPVAGTGTAVWWETMIDGQTVFGIPQVGMRSITEGVLVENHDLLPDILVNNEYEKFTIGIDQQLKAAVEELMK